MSKKKKSHLEKCKEFHWPEFVVGVLLGCACVWCVYMITHPFTESHYTIVENYLDKQSHGEDVSSLAFSIINVADCWGGGHMESDIQGYLDYKKKHNEWNASCDELQEIITPHKGETR